MVVNYKKKTIEQVDVTGKRVFVRADLNVPLDDRQQITNDRRVRASVPTLKYLLDQGAAVIVASHLGRPKGVRKPEMSLKPVADRLGELLGRSVQMAPDCIGEQVEKMASALKGGQVLMLENVRFHAEETKNDEAFAGHLGALAEVYVNDAFGTAHRAHASTEGITKHMHPCVAGYLISKELQYLGEALANPKRPLLAILGGAKVGSKIGVITSLMKLVDHLVIGGGMAYTFLKVQGFEIGASLFDEESADTARQIIEQADQAGIKLWLPVDCLVADKIDASAQTKVVDARQIPAGWMGVDAGPRTIEQIEQLVAEAKTVMWNGPVGIFEQAPFAGGTKAVGQALAKADALTILGGGETAMAAEQFGVDHQMSHVSTGGGASLEFLEGKQLPGILALDDA